MGDILFNYARVPSILGFLAPVAHNIPKPCADREKKVLDENSNAPGVGYV